MAENGSTSEPVLLTEGGLTPQLLERTDMTEAEILGENLDKTSVHDEEDECGYVPPVADPYARAIKYMEQHNVMQIFQRLTAEIIYRKPDDPLSHMLKELQKMKKERGSNLPPAERATSN